MPDKGFEPRICNFVKSSLATGLVVDSRLSIGGSKPQNEKPEAKPRIESRNEAKVAPEVIYCDN